VWPGFPAPEAARSGLIGYLWTGEGGLDFLILNSGRLKVCSGRASLGVYLFIFSPLNLLAGIVISRLWYF
jgi:hypothetical protein